MRRTGYCGDAGGGAPSEAHLGKLAKQGACSETNWPYTIANFTKKPPKGC
ncbi:hypothetical protein [Geomonas silvestris]|nr:hypothetical protein [Geomonas silvestris]